MRNDKFFITGMICAAMVSIALFIALCTTVFAMTSPTRLRENIASSLDDSFLRTLEKCVTTRYMESETNSYSNLQLLTLEDAILDYEGKQLTHSAILEQSKIYIEGLKEQHSALDGKVIINNELWESGCLKRASAIKALQEAHKINLDDEIYANYATEFIRGEIANRLIGRYNINPSESHVEIPTVNSSYLDFNDVKIHVFWNKSNDDTIVASKNTWHANEQWDIVIDLPLDKAQDYTLLSYLTVTHEMHTMKLPPTA